MSDSFFASMKHTRGSAKRLDSFLHESKFVPSAPARGKRTNKSSAASGKARSVQRKAPSRQSQAKVPAVKRVKARVAPKVAAAVPEAERKEQPVAPVAELKVEHKVVEGKEEKKDVDVKEVKGAENKEQDDDETPKDIEFGEEPKYKEGDVLPDEAVKDMQRLRAPSIFNTGPIILTLGQLRQGLVVVGPYWVENKEAKYGKSEVYQVQHVDRLTLQYAFQGQVHERHVVVFSSDHFLHPRPLDVQRLLTVDLGTVFEGGLHTHLITANHDRDYAWVYAEISPNNYQLLPRTGYPAVTVTSSKTMVKFSLQRPVYPYDPTTCIEAKALALLQRKRELTVAHRCGLPVADIAEEMFGHYCRRFKGLVAHPGWIEPLLMTLVNRGLVALYLDEEQRRNYMATSTTAEFLHKTWDY